MPTKSSKKGFRLSPEKLLEVERALSKGSGRLERVRAAFDDGAFRDDRLARSAFAVIDDLNVELADFVADHILPLYGSALMEELRGTFRVKGGKAHARRLKLMHLFDRNGSRDLVLEGVKRGTVDVKIAAIRCPGDHPDCFDLLMEFRGETNWRIQQAALDAICQLSTPGSEAYLLEIMDGEEVHLLRGRCSPTLTKTAIKRARALLPNIAEGSNRPNTKKQVARLGELLELLNGEKTTEVAKLLSSCLDLSDKLGQVKIKWGSTVLEGILMQLGLGSQKMVKRLVDSRNEIPPQYFGIVADAARKWQKPDLFFNTFSPYLLPTAAKKTPEGIRSGCLVESLFEDELSPLWRYQPFRDGANKKSPLHQDWLKLAIKQDQSQLVVEFATSSNNLAEAYLTKLWKANERKPTFQVFSIVAGMAHSGHPQSVEVYKKLLESKVLSKKFDPDYQRWLYLLQYFPPDLTAWVQELIKHPKCSDEAKWQIPRWLSMPFDKYFRA